jgi:hypothetical protein
VNIPPESVLIVLELPNPCLSPNRPPGSIGGRIRKASAAKRYRRLAREAAEAEGISSGPWEQATIRATFFHRTRRRRDDVNFLAMLKPAYDGIVDSGLLADDDAEHLTTLGASFELDREAPRVELRLERVL